MQPVIFLSVDDVIEVHRRAIEEHGGEPGPRDRGLLESAVALAQASFGGQSLHESMSDKAGAYHFHLCSNHAFIDGNNRVAIIASELCLLLNGYELLASDEQIEELTLGVASSKISKFQVLEFFGRHARELCIGRASVSPALAPVTAHRAAGETEVGVRRLGSTLGGRTSSAGEST